jgi:hypothetical protein
MIPKASGRWSTMLPTTTIGSINKPVTIMKLGMNKAFPKNSSLTLAGLSWTAQLTASPARNAPTIPGRFMGRRPRLPPP